MYNMLNIYTHTAHLIKPQFGTRKNCCAYRTAYA